MLFLYIACWHHVKPLIDCGQTNLVLSVPLTIVDEFQTPLGTCYKTYETRLTQEVLLLLDSHFHYVHYKILYNNIP